MENPKNPEKIAIAAIQTSENKEFDRVLGQGRKLIYRHPEDMRRFRERVKGQVMLVGRETFESMRDEYNVPIDKNSNVVVLTTNPNYDAGDATVVNSKEEALEKVDQMAREIGSDICIIGGGKVYDLFLDETKRVHLTEFPGDKPGDAKFPELGDEFEETHREALTETEGDSEKIICYFVDYERKS